MTSLHDIKADSGLDGARETVLLGMSGGVDSSVSAIVLKEDGYAVQGATMILADNSQGITSQDILSKDIQDAIVAAAHLGIEHYVIDNRQAFENKVVSEFCNSYICGRTPNPCIDCNRLVKFKGLDDKRAELGFDMIATGHYARKAYDPELEKFTLLKAKDAWKDQSYVLAYLSQEQLARTLFPLGDLSKAEVRQIASSSGLANAQKGESQDICFIPDGKYDKFIEEHLGKSLEPGPIYDMDGKKLGEHNGLLKYTIGQRKGLGIASERPLYVFDKDVSSNALIVCEKENLFTKEVHGSSSNLVTYDIADVAGKEIEGSAKTSYRHKCVDCTAVFEADGSLNVEFKENVERPASGQTLVVYEGDKVVGAAIIE